MDTGDREMKRPYSNISHPSVSVPCPYCNQPAGVPCIRIKRDFAIKQDRRFVETHRARVWKWEDMLKHQHLTVSSYCVTIIIYIKNVAIKTGRNI